MDTSQVVIIAIVAAVVFGIARHQKKQEPAPLCTGCGQEVAQGVKFCSNCGQDQGVSVPRERHIPTRDVPVPFRSSANEQMWQGVNSGFGACVVMPVLLILIGFLLLILLGLLVN